jgi:acyl-CoA thioesterase-1
MHRAAVVPLVVVTACIGREESDLAEAHGSGPATLESERPTLESGERSSAIGADRASEDPVVVVFLGTSLTAGQGLEREADRYPDLIGAMADSAGIPIDVVNAGVGGDTSAGALRRIEWILRNPVDVLVVELGANDGLRGLDTTQLESNLRQIARQARGRYPDLRIVFVGMEAPPNLGPRYTERFRSVYPRVAREEGATLLPFLLEGVAGNPDLNQVDGIHPNREGHRIMARDVVWPGLEPILREAASAKRSATRP